MPPKRKSPNNVDVRPTKKCKVEPSRTRVLVISSSSDSESTVSVHEEEKDERSEELQEHFEPKLIKTEASKQKKATAASEASEDLSDCDHSKKDEAWPCPLGNLQAHYDLDTGNSKLMRRWKANRTFRESGEEKVLAKVREHLFFFAPFLMCSTCLVKHGRSAIH